MSKLLETIKGQFKVTFSRAGCTEGGSAIEAIVIFNCHRKAHKVITLDTRDIEMSQKIKSGGNLKMLKHSLGLPQTEHV